MSSDPFSDVLRLAEAQSVLSGGLVAGGAWAFRFHSRDGALRLMHEEPGRTWSLNDLAKAAGMSRARFAARFKSAAGVAPLVYLTELRMRVAQKMLREEGSPILDVAASLGYKSERAFSHAFKRVTGAGPRAYRTAEARRAAVADATTRPGGNGSLA